MNRLLEDTITEKRHIIMHDFYQVSRTNIIPGRQQSKTLIPSTNVDQKSLETEFFYCHLSPDWPQMAIIKNWF